MLLVVHSVRYKNSYIYSVLALSPPLHFSIKKILLKLFYFRATNHCLKRGLPHRLELGAGKLLGELLALGEDVASRSE